MRRFRFKMQTVLETREREEDLARVALAEVERLLAECEENLNALITRQIEHQKEMARIGRTIQRTDEMNELFHYSQLIVEQIDDQNHLLAEVEKRLEERRLALQKIVQERKMLESLKDKHHQEWQQDVFRAEQEVLDEIGGAAHHRQGERGSAMTNALVILVALLFAGVVFYGVFWINNLLTNRFNPSVTIEHGKNTSASGEVESATGEAHVASATGEVASASHAASGHVISASSINWSNIASIRAVQEEAFHRTQELARMEEEIEQKRASLETYAGEIEASRKAVEERIQYYESLKADVERREKMIRDSKIESLAQVYNGMDADVVAGFILSVTDNEEAVTILSKMQAFAAQEVIQNMGRDEKNKARAKAILEAWTAGRKQS